jgi:hypothetical protein
MISKCGQAFLHYSMFDKSIGDLALVQTHSRREVR